MLRDERPDLVHTNSLKSGIYGSLAARLAGVPVVWHVRDRIADDYLGRPLTRLVRLLLALLPTAILVNSEATRRTIGTARRRVPSAVLDDPYRPAEVASPRGRPHDPPVVALVGRMAPWKGQHLFLDALERLPESLGVQGLLLGSALFGEEEYAAGVERRVASTNNARVSSFAGDVSDALTDVDVVVNASVIPEPFGQVVVEAIANGVPVVVPDQGGPAEIVQHGSSGLVYRAGDADSLAARLAVVLGDTDLYARLSAGGLERARAYDPEQVAQQYLAFVRRVPGTASPSS
jgi:glycosyltransferase involved in cell wall biosynthesis